MFIIISLRSCILKKFKASIKDMNFRSLKILNHSLLQVIHKTLCSEGNIFQHGSKPRGEVLSSMTGIAKYLSDKKTRIPAIVLS